MLGRRFRSFEIVSSLSSRTTSEVKNARRILARYSLSTVSFSRPIWDRRFANSGDFGGSCPRRTSFRFKAAALGVRGERGFFAIFPVFFLRKSPGGGL